MEEERTLALISPAEIDKIVCDWTMQEGISLTEEQLNNLVDSLCALLGLLQ